MASEMLRKDQNVETARHNVVSERLGQGQLAVSRGSLEETIRSNTAREKETQRTNVAREKETYRSNIANELLANMQISEQQRSNLANEAERMRSNINREREAQRSNLAREAETHRSNTIHEQLTTDKIIMDNLSPHTAATIAYEATGRGSFIEATANSLSSAWSTLFSPIRLNTK